MYLILYKYSKYNFFVLSKIFLVFDPYMCLWQLVSRAWVTYILLIGESARIAVVDYVAEHSFYAMSTKSTNWPKCCGDGFDGCIKSWNLNLSKLWRRSNRYATSLDHKTKLSQTAKCFQRDTSNSKPSTRRPLWQ